MYNSDKNLSTLAGLRAIGGDESAGDLPIALRVPVT